LTGGTVHEVSSGTGAGVGNVVEEGASRTSGALGGVQGIAD
jgi:hypothetical protein